MKILVTGANGFVGRNLIATLEQMDGIEVFPFDVDTDDNLFEPYVQNCDFVCHLAGVNRPRDAAEFTRGNVDFTSRLIRALSSCQNACPVLMTSSIQAALGNPYGESKKAAEDLLFAHAETTGAKVMIYRLTNLFGKWCRPNYNSVVATFCHNIARDLPIVVDNQDTVLRLIYIDDLVEEIVNAIHGRETPDGKFCAVNENYTVKLGEISRLLYDFKDSRKTLYAHDAGDLFVKKLYCTYLSYLPGNEFKYPLKMNVDARGSFTEFMKTLDCGQFSVNISKPGITKGNHWHHTKIEKFLVVSGEGLIRLRKIFSDEILNYPVSGEKLEVVDIPPGYTHSLENTGTSDLVTLMWADECYDPDRPDTYFLTVKPDGE